jgi:hypothetical protein
MKIVCMDCDPSVVVSESESREKNGCDEYL